MTRPIAGLNCEGKVLFAAARLGLMSRKTSSLTSRLSCSSPAAVVAGAAAGGGGAGVLSFWISSSCLRILSCICCICCFSASSSRRSCCAASGVRDERGAVCAYPCAGNEKTMAMMSACVVLRMLSSFPTACLHVPPATQEEV